MRPLSPVSRLLVCFAVLGSFTGSLAADELYEKKIRPVLIEHCYRCHSADAVRTKKLKAGLQLDTRDGVLHGGDSGPGVMANKPAESLLLRVLKYDGDIQMPPGGKLPDAVIADFEKWVAAGVPGLPTGGGLKAQAGMSVEDGRKFWAYQPLPLDRTSQPIDQYIRARVSAAGLKPASPADKATLVRRLYFDLIGLPPTPDQIDEFVSDSSADAYERQVDRLLASPQFGERWGRHWLDVARYAESVTLRGLVFREAWRYRDYVIDAFNRDVPFDRFVREQIAGDLLPATDLEEQKRNRIATAFLVLGNTNLEEQDKKQLRMDVVDEQLDVIGKGILGQTITCARCHDHKFDPIPTKDYYALAGILRNAKAMEHANVSNWVEVPLPVPAEQEQALADHEAKVAALQASIKQARAKANPKGASGVLAAKDVNGIVVDDAQAKRVGEWQHSTHSGTYIGAGYTHDQNAGKGQKTLTFQPDRLPPGRYEVRLAYSHGPSRSAAVPVTVFSADGEKAVAVNMKPAPPIAGRFVSLGEFRYEQDGQCHVIVSNEGTTGHVTADAVVFVPHGDAATAAKATADSGAARAAGEAKALEAALQALQAVGPKRPKAMSVVEEKQIEEIRVHIRGSVHSLGEPAPRGFLQVATTGPAPAFPKGQSGRRELADWLASGRNPLTARVYVNRAWHWLFGAGLVRTPDNFGTTGEKPSHPELLDDLAAEFVRSGWSTKKLVRRIVTSDTYRRSSAADDKTTSADPENRLFGRANRRRLEAECIRDAMLAVSGRLDPTAGGPLFPPTLAADYGFQTDSERRSVYLPQFRNALPEALDVFDAADPSLVTGKRNTSTVPQQALFLLNHPFPQAQARHAAEKLLGEKRSDADAVRRAYRLALGREPTAGERDVAVQFLATQSDRTTAWTTLFQALFATPDFRFVD